jgi:hypothetical protein
MKTEMTEQERRAALNQLHVAEYQALTTRSSYWIILQASLLPAVPIYLALAVQVWSANVMRKEIVVWGALAGLQLIAILWANVLAENYAAVNYIERYLHPLAEDTVGPALFWGYEPYLTLHRPTKRYLGELFIPALGVLVLLATCYVRFSAHTRWDVCGSIVNAVLLYFLVRKSLKAVKIIREWSEFDTDRARRLEMLTKWLSSIQKEDGGIISRPS